MSSKEGLWQQHGSEVPTDIAIFHIVKFHIERKSSMLCTNPKTSFLHVSIRLEKTEWNFIGTQMVEYKDKIPIKER